MAIGMVIAGTKQWVICLDCRVGSNDFFVHFQMFFRTIKLVLRLDEKYFSMTGYNEMIDHVNTSTNFRVPDGF